MLQSYSATGVVKSIKFTQSENVSRIFFRLEIKEYGKTKNGKQAITVIPCIIWGRLAENFNEVVREYDMVSISGRILTAYDQKTGQSSFSCEVEKFSPTLTYSERVLRELMPHQVQNIDKIMQSRFGSQFILRDSERAKLLPYFTGKLDGNQIREILETMFKESDYSADRFVELAKGKLYNEQY